MRDGSTGLPTAPRRRPVPDTVFGGRLTDAFLLELVVADLEDLASHVRRVTFALSSTS